MSETKLKRGSIPVMPWYVTAGEDGLMKDAILVARMDGNEIVSISLHMAQKPAEQLPD